MRNDTREAGWSRRLLWRLAGLCLCLAPVVEAQVDGYAEFPNHWPAPDPEAGGTWSASTAVYSGHVGPVTDGRYTLHWSRIGQAVEGPTLEGGHFLLGEELTAAENVGDGKQVPAAAMNYPGGRLYWPPDIVDIDPATGESTGKPAERVFYVSHAGKVFASAPGAVRITWYSLGREPIPVDPADPGSGTEFSYLIAAQPVRPPVRIYWTDRYDEVGNLTPTGAPAVDVTGFHVVPHYHHAIPSRLSDTMDPPALPNPDDYDGDPYPAADYAAAYQQYQRDLEAYADAQNTRFLWKSGNSLRAQGRTGDVVVEFNADENTFIDVAVVQLRRYSPDRWPVGSRYGPRRRVGEELEPQGGRKDTDQAYVARGLSGESPYVYQHGVDGPDKGKVYAVRTTANDLQVEVFWQQAETLGASYDVLWPYEMRRYEVTWPETPQIFVRGHSVASPGRSVTVPEALHPELMPHQEFGTPGAHATLEGNVVDANGEGLFLLRYNLGTPPGATGVAFEVVRAVRHDILGMQDMAGSPWPTTGGVPTDIGKEITDAYHEGPEPGYVHVCDYADDDAGYRDPHNDRYAVDIYTGTITSTGQIFPVNTGMLEVWWCNLSQGVQWPSTVVRYRCEWPAAGSDGLQAPIVIASETGTGPIDAAMQANWSIYVQNDPARPGYNPNDEHALALDPANGPVFALRDDLGADETSWPYVLVQYQDPADDERWRFDVYPVERGDLRFTGTAGQLLAPPLPISQMPPYGSENVGVSGPFWEDRKERHWARAAGDDGGTAEIVMHWYYPVQEGFTFPGGTAYAHAVGAHVPWLDLGASTPGTPIDAVYTVAWPDGVPELYVGETLVKSKNGLPDISVQASVAIVYQQSLALGQGPSAYVIDPTRERTTALAAPPPTLVMQRDSSLGEYRFPELAPHLYQRLSYDDVRGLLTWRGVLVEPVIGEYHLLPNVIAPRDKTALVAAGFAAATIDALAASEPILADDASPATGDTGFASRAVTAGRGEGAGYVTLAFQDNPEVCAAGLPVTLAVIRVTCPLYRGEIKVIEPDCPLYEKLTLRHSGDFAGTVDRFIFEWRTLPDTEGQPPTHGYPPAVHPEYWQIHVAGTAAAGTGVVDTTLGGAGLLTLTDNWFVCRYRPASAGGPCGDEWSAWTEPQLSEGWIKRVVRGINPYEQRFTDLGDPTRTLNTLVTMISQAGPRPEAGTVLDPDAIDSAGLIEVYQAVLNRALSLSLDGTPALSSDAAPGLTNALLLAASRIAQLYMLLGNEAYADAADPTLGFGVNPSEAYMASAPSLHAFMNLTSSLLEEELALLRGRDDSLAPDVRLAPIYNRLPWNFTSGLGEVAYALNYDIRDDVTGEPDGVLDETDAKRLYPQGHGDAWGHYLTATTGYYTLLTHPNFTWVPRAEAVLMGGVPATVDYFDERLFAAAAAAKARTGAEIVNLVYRSRYVEDPEEQWQGYKDTDPERAWGLSEWGLRAGQAAYLDWVVGNAILPCDDRDVGWYVDDVTIATAAATELFVDDFQTGSGHWSTSGEWHAEGSAELIDPWYHSATTAMACNGSSGGYATGLVHSLELVAPVEIPPGAQSVVLSWWDYVGLRAGGDAVRVEVGIRQIDDNGTPADPGDDVTSYAWEEVYNSTESRKKWGAADPLDPATAVPVQVSLDPYAGRWIKVRFSLAADTPDAAVSDVRRIDRITVPELRQITAAYADIQAQIDSADTGLNPFGLAANAMSFDIDPQQIDAGRTHFEQIHDRAVQALGNAAAAFANAGGTAQSLRRQADTLHDFQTNVIERETDFRNRLIEIYGYPYADDIGPGGAYPAGYTGPDLYHYMLVDTSELTGSYEDEAPTETFTVTIEEPTVAADGSLASTRTEVTYEVATTGFGIVLPESWRGRRQAMGELQMALSEMLQARGRFLQALENYDGVLATIEDQAELLEAQHALNAEEIIILNQGKNTQESYNDMIVNSRKRQYWLRSTAEAALYIANAMAEFLPTSAGMSMDVTSGARGAIRFAGTVYAKALGYLADAEGRAEAGMTMDKEIAQAETNIEVTTVHGEFAALQQLKQLEQAVRQEAGTRYDIYVLREALEQSQQRYLAALARGVRLQEDLLRFRQQTAAELQENRYKDMAFRVFRNDALQKYRAQFDLAARYVYLAARAYDYETNLLDEDARGAGTEFLTQIVRSRALGLLENGQPQLASDEGDPGLADALARMMLNWNLVLKGQLGFNNPQTETARFSLRRELYHLSAASADDVPWRQNLANCVSANLLTEPAFRRYCRAFYPQQADEPGLIIPFSSHIEFGTNFFGLPLWGGDSAYDSSNFATKIRSVGVWFSNYSTLAEGGLSNTPRVYLVPVGQDKMRSPTGYSGDTRDWTLLDQLIPVPFPINGGDLADPDWIPLFDSLTGELAGIRRYPSFRAYHDSGSFSESEVARDSRLIGRSVWNTQWLLIIPAGTLHSDRDEALRRFIYGRLVAGGPVLDDLGQQRDGNGVSDVRLFFQTYAYSGAKRK